MHNYSTDTWLSFLCRGDASEILDLNLPVPHHFHREDARIYAVAWLISGFFGTGKGTAYLNDIIARMAISVPIITRLEPPANCSLVNPLRLAAFQNLHSLPATFRRRSAAEQVPDRVFWALKIHSERLIKHSSGWFPYAVLESWAFSVFSVPDDVKDRSTLRAKCRNVWFWYESRGFTIPDRRKTTMTRKEAGPAAAAKKALDAKARVVGAVAALEFMGKEINPANVSRYAGVHRHTARKYLRELDQSEPRRV